jgi:hypothetical protein
MNEMNETDDENIKYLRGAVDLIAEYKRDVEGYKNINEKIMHHAHEALMITNTIKYRNFSRRRRYLRKHLRKIRNLLVILKRFEKQELDKKPDITSLFKET